jgi:hypothetical protein
VGLPEDPVGNCNIEWFIFAITFKLQDQNLLYLKETKMQQKKFKFILTKQNFMKFDKSG